MLATEVPKLEAQFVKLHMAQSTECRAPVLHCVQPLWLHKGDTQLGSPDLEGHCCSPHLSRKMVCALWEIWDGSSSVFRLDTLGQGKGETHTVKPEMEIRVIS